MAGIGYREGSIRILIADDSEAVRRALKDLLDEDSRGWEICGEVESGPDALEKVTKLLPDVLLLDVSIPLLHGVTVAQVVRRDYPDVRVVLMSEQDASVLSRLAEVAGTPYHIAKSRMAVDLIPLLLSSGKT
ncbi:MAG: response regulator [Candidatus Sulfotelmatobacter sp.]